MMSVCDTSPWGKHGSRGLLTPQWRPRLSQGMWTPWWKQRFCPSVAVSEISHKIMDLHILGTKTGIREAKFSSVTHIILLSLHRWGLLCQQELHCYFPDYTASLNIKSCMKMLYLDNRLYLNVKCVLGACFYSAVLFLCKISFCKVIAKTNRAPWK